MQKSNVYHCNIKHQLKKETTFLQTGTTHLNWL